MRGLVDGTVEATTNAPPAVVTVLDDLLGTVDTYRDAALMVLAFAIEAGTTAEVAIPPAGRRGVAQRFAALCDELHIPARRDAFQTLAKGTATLSGRDRAAWNELLDWAEHEANLTDVEQALAYLASGIAATARHLPELSTLDPSLLTFRRTIGIVDFLLATPSHGAHEQFVFAALLHALAEEHGGRRVETKHLYAADASASTAADVQVFEGGKLIEAYEVTASSWTEKVAQAAAVLRHYDLARVHIVAPGPAPTAAQIADVVAVTPLPSGLVSKQFDLSVLDVRAECRSLVHRLSRPGRRSSLHKLWEHLVTRQPRDDIVVAYVQTVTSAGVVVPL